MPNALERKVADLERRVSPPPAPVPRYVLLQHEFERMSPQEKADVFRQIVRGEVAYETGRDPRPVRVADKGALERMTPEQRVAEYRRALAEALGR